MRGNSPATPVRGVKETCTLIERLLIKSLQWNLLVSYPDFPHRKGSLAFNGRFLVFCKGRPRILDSQ